MGEAFIKKYPKYCVKCNKYYPAAWKECTFCKRSLVWAGHGYALQWIKRIDRWLIGACIIGVAFWGANKAWTRYNQGEVAAYVQANALDVIELNDGRKSIGKIVGETPKSYFIKNTKGAEEKIDRSIVKIRRRASSAELEIARVLLTKRIDQLAAQRGTIWGKVCAMLDSVVNRVETEIKYYREVAAARDAKHALERKLVEEKSAEPGEEGLSIERRFLQWAQSGGMPSKKEE